MRKALVFKIKVEYNQERTLVWDTSEKYLRDAAYIELFNIIDSELGSYEIGDSVVCALLGLARNGNPEACEALLCYRRNKNGEQFEEVDIRRGDFQPVLSDAKPRPGKKIEIEPELLVEETE